MPDIGKSPGRVLALGATSAIAEATLRSLSHRNAHFFLVGRNAQKLAAVRADLLTRGAASVAIYVADLNDTSGHAALLEQAAEELGAIDLALIAHGVLGDQSQAQTDYSAAEQILRTNLLSSVSLITWLANYFERNCHGVLAVISSVAGDRGRKSNYVYGASKGGLNIFLEGVRNRIDRSGVHVLIIKPGFVATPMTAHLPRNSLYAKPSTVAKGILKAIEKRRDVAYVPSVWAYIMVIVRAIPGKLFKKMNM